MTLNVTKKGEFLSLLISWAQGESFQFGANVPDTEYLHSTMRFAKAGFFQQGFLSQQRTFPRAQTPKSLTYR